MADRLIGDVIEYSKQVHGVTHPNGKEQRYYVALGRACDWILRCKDCQQLVTSADIAKRGSCACGNRRFAEITMLSEQEHASIVSGAIDFPHREDFLREFAPCE
ncbi:MAG TPA: hypothetical protein VEC39_17680 [Vicinamibacterales bacterium]|nr:hypothetical protein [Vicinamibacterales bacterium]